jgi:uncharacterized membrane protein YraQ (UPF0718 family)
MSVGQRLAFTASILAPTVAIVGYFAWVFSAPIRERSESQVFVIVLFSILLEAIPFVLIGALAASVIEVLVTPEQVERLVPRNRLLAVTMGAFLGVLFPVCECGVIPVVRRLIAKGVPVPVAVSYLLAAPIVNPVVIASTIIAFRGGSDRFVVPILRVTLGVSIAIVVGLFLSRGGAASLGFLAPVACPGEPSQLPARVGLAGTGNGPDGFAVLRRLGRASPQGKHAHPEDPPGEAAWTDGEALAGPGATWGDKVAAILAHASGEFVDIGSFLVLGSLIAACTQTFVPKQTLLALGGNLPASILVMMGLAFVLSLCSEADAFVARSFIQFTTAAKLAFLVLGPMLDIKLLFMYLSTFRRRFILTVVLSVVLLNFVAALVVGLVLHAVGAR